MSTSNKAILCVDDEHMVLQALRDQIAKNFGDRYRYEVAESTDEAWEVIEELDLDGVEILLIISDWLMPDMRGDDFLIQIHQKFPKLATILLTGHADETAIQRACQYAKIHAYLAKPWSEATLIETIRSGLREFGDESSGYLCR